MSILNETSHANEALVAELPGEMSRDVVTILADEVLPAQQVLGKITASGKFVALNPGAADGSEVAAAILYAAVDATGADKLAVVHYKDAVFNAGEVVWTTGMTGPQITTATGQLKAAGIILR